MAQASLPHSVAALRAITYRLSSTPIKQLPPVAAQIAASIWSCKDVLSANPDSSKLPTEITNIAHRFKTTITSLLQDRTIEGRWVAVVLTKAAIEAGGLAILSKANGWVKCLIAILKKSDPPTTRKLAVITLTRIFMLTWDHSNLVREITTPALPAFISTCLTNAIRERCPSGELEAVLESFATLIARHPTVFRAHENQIRSLLVRILSVTSSSAQNGPSISRSHQRAAARLLVLLHHCAPKQGAGDAWQATWTSTINTAQETCDVLFRSVIEEALLAGDARQPAQSKLSTGEAESTSANALGLQAWNGIYAGSERLIDLLDVLKAHLEMSTANALTVRLGLVIDLISRILRITLDVGNDSSRINHQFPREEREALLFALPNIHGATLDLVRALLRRFGSASVPFVQMLYELILAVFVAESSRSSTRTAVYTTFNLILELVGPSMSRAEVVELNVVVSSCCRDLNPASHTADTQQNQIEGHANGTATHNLKIETRNCAHPTQLSDLNEAASKFLATFVTRINPSAVPNKSRVEVERTAIFTRNKEALVACVLNPAAKKSGGGIETSLLPILAKEFPDVPEVEALLRPRMPPISSRGAGEEHADADYRVNGEDSTENEMLNVTSTYDQPSTEYMSGMHPTNDLDNLQRQEDELYSVTPPLRHIGKDILAEESIDDAQDGLSANKRPRNAETDDAAGAAKRTRTEPELETHVGAEVGPGDSSPSTQMQSETAPIPRIQQSYPKSHQLQTARDFDVAGTPATVITRVEETRDDDQSSDGSDFEMPPLTMEPDTDPEDEDDEDQK